MKEMLLSAREGRYAVPAINVGNYESVSAAIEAAEAERSPLVIQFYKRLVEDGHAERLAPAIRRMAEQTPTPVVLHLDHGDTVSLVSRCVDCGFTSVMIDGSTLPFAENVRLVQSSVQVAQAAGVSVEAELGHVRFGEDDSIEAGLTDPSEAAEFADQTGVDALAIAIGTAHGMYKRAPVLDFDRLQRIAAETRIPLVLHGGSDTPLGDAGTVYCAGHYQDQHRHGISGVVSAGNYPSVAGIAGSLSADRRLHEARSGKACGVRAGEDEVVRVKRTSHPDLILRVSTASARERVSSPLKRAS